MTLSFSIFSFLLSSHAIPCPFRRGWQQKREKRKAFLLEFYLGAPKQRSLSWSLWAPSNKIQRKGKRKRWMKRPAGHEVTELCSLLTQLRPLHLYLFSFTGTYVLTIWGEKSETCQTFPFFAHILVREMPFAKRVNFVHHGISFSLFSFLFWPHPQIKCIAWGQKEKEKRKVPAYGFIAAKCKFLYSFNLLWEFGGKNPNGWEHVLVLCYSIFMHGH